MSALGPYAVTYVDGDGAVLVSAEKSLPVIAKTPDDIRFLATTCFNVLLVPVLEHRQTADRPLEWRRKVGSCGICKKRGTTWTHNFVSEERDGHFFLRSFVGMACTGAGTACNAKMWKVVHRVGRESLPQGDEINDKYMVSCYNANCVKASYDKAYLKR